jgi:hypothetical protein
MGFPKEKYKDDVNWIKDSHHSVWSSIKIRERDEGGGLKTKKRQRRDVARQLVVQPPLPLFTCQTATSST